MSGNNKPIQSVEAMKESIAEKYIQEIKKDLSFLEQLVIGGLFQKEMKDFLLDEDQKDIDFSSLDMDIFQKLGRFFYSKTLDTIFEKLKEKKEVLIKAGTQKELANLEAEIQGLPLPYPELEAEAEETSESDDLGPSTSVAPKTEAGEKSLLEAGSVGAAIAGGSLGIYGLLDRANRMKAIEQVGDIEKAKKSMKELADTFEATSKTKGYEGVIARRYMDQATMLRKTAENLDVAGLKALDAWQELGADAKLLHIFALDDDALKAISKLTKRELQDLVSMSVDEAVDFLQGKGVRGASDEVAEALIRLGSKGQVDNLLSALQGVSKVAKLGKFVSALPILDVLVLVTSDRNAYNTAVAEALDIDNAARRDNALQQARFNWRVDVASAGVSSMIGVAGIAAGLAAAGPPGWAVAVAGATVAAAAEAGKHIVNTLYYDSRDFFLQNREDLGLQYRTEIKQSILQFMAARYEGTIEAQDDWIINIMLHVPIISESVQIMKLFLDWKRNSSIDTHMQDQALDTAWQALLLSDMLDRNSLDYPYISQVVQSGLTWHDYQIESGPDDDFVQGYEKEMDRINGDIDLRMSYIRTKMPQQKGDQKALVYLGGNGIRQIENVLEDAHWYAEMKSGTGYVEQFVGDDVDAYKQAYEAKLRSVNPQAFTQLEEFFSQPSKDILHTPGYLVSLYKEASMYMAVLGDGSTEPDFELMRSQYTYFSHYYHYKLGSQAREQQIDVGDIPELAISYSQTKTFLMSLGNASGLKFGTYTWTKEELIDHFTGERGLILNEVVKLHEGSLEVSDSLGQNILYEIARQLHGYEGSNDMMELVMFYKKSKKSSLGLYYDDGWYINEHIGRDACITELAEFERLGTQDIMRRWFGDHIVAGRIANADQQLQQEYYSTVQAIVEQEKGYRSSEQQEKLQLDLLEYVQAYGSQGYVMLPQHFLRQLAKAGLGDMRDMRFIYEAGSKTLRVCTMGSKGLDLPEISSNPAAGVDEVIYESLQPLREELTSEEQEYINYVEQAHVDVTNIMSVSGAFTHEDDLDIPVEIENSISDKREEWKKLEESLYLYQPSVALQLLHKSYQEYVTYFSGLYTGLLAGIASHSFVNDMDDIEYMQVSLLLTKTKELYHYNENTKNIELSPPIQVYVSDSQQKILFQLFDVPLSDYEGKSISQLSQDVATRDKALWLAHQNLLALWESSTLLFDEHGKVTSISVPSNSSYVSDLFDKSDPYSHIKGLNLLQKQYLHKRIMARYSGISSADLPDLSTLDMSSIVTRTPDIQTVSQEYVQTHQETHDAIQQIEQTAASVDWREERGRVTFDHRTCMLSSWGQDTKLDLDHKCIDDLSLTLSLDDMVWVAHLINWFKHYKASHPDAKFYYGSRFGSHYGIYNAVGLIDTRLLTQDQLEHKYSSIMDANIDVKKEFIHYINTL